MKDIACVVHQDDVAVGIIPQGTTGVLKMLVVNSSEVQTEDDVLFLVVHFLLLQKGWIPVDVRKGEQSKGSVSGLHQWMPPKWSSSEPRNGSSVVVYKDEQQQEVTISCLRVDDQVLVHLHVGGTTETLSAELCIKDVVNTFDSSWVDELNLRRLEEVGASLQRSLFPNGSETTRKRKTAKKSSGRSSSLRAENAKQPASGKGSSGGEQGFTKPNRGGGIGRGGVRPGSFGFDQDLHPNFGGGMGGLGGLGGLGGMGGMGGMGGGSMVGPSHPGFGMRPQPGTFPAPGVPPSARFDPFGPGVPGVPANNGHQGGPTPDHLPPPNTEDRPDWMYQ